MTGCDHDCTQERTLPDACRQLFWQHLEHIYTFSTAADTLGWNISGAFAAPPATFDHCEMQLLYVNSRAAACSVLQILLKDWFAQSLRLFQASERNSTGKWLWLWLCKISTASAKCPLYLSVARSGCPCLS